MPPIHSLPRSSPLYRATRTREPLTVAKTLAPVIPARVDRYEAAKRAAAVGPVNPVTNPADWHLPKLDEVFELARQYPGKEIFLDLKLPADNPEIAQRMAAQLIEVLRRYPDMKDRVVIGLPNKANLDTLKAAFSSAPGFADFKNFTFDHEELNVVGLGAGPADAHPLHGSGDNKYVSIGDPKTPGAKGNWDEDLIGMCKDTLKQASDPSNPNYGKKLIVWTVNDPEKIKQLAELGVHAIMTDDPDTANAILDKLYAKDDPKRPKVMCHRGGPDDGFAPENTLPMIERGLRKGDAIEIDLVSCKDGVALFHDNDAEDLVGTIRNLGFEGGAFRPTHPGVLSALRGVPAHELTIDQLRKGYGYEKTWPDAPFQTSKSPFIRGVGKVFGAVHTGALAVLRFAGALGLGALEAVKSLGSWVGNAAKKAVEGVGNAVKSIGKAIGGFFKGLFGKKKKKAPRPPASNPTPIGVRATPRRPSATPVFLGGAASTGVVATARRPPPASSPSPAEPTPRRPTAAALPRVGSYGSSGFD